MSEVLTTSVAEAEYQVYESDNSVGKNIENDPLTSLIESNANTLVRCPWLDNTVVTLSEAVLSYSAKISLITAENIHVVASVMRDLLANPVIEAQEPEEKDEPEENEPEEEPAKTEQKPVKAEENDKQNDDKREAKTVQTNTSKVDAPRQTKNAIEAAKPLEPAVSRLEKTSEAGRNSARAAKAGAVTNLVQSESKQSTLGGSKTEVTKSPVKVQSEGAKPVSKLEAGSKRQIPAVEVHKAHSAVGPAVEAEPAQDKPQPDADQEIEPVVTPDNTTEQNLEIIEEIEEEPASEALDYPIDAYEVTNLAEDEEVLLDHLEEAGLEPEESYGFSDMPTLEAVDNNLEAEEEPIFDSGNESDLSWQTEVTGQEQLVQTSLTVEEIEDSLIRLAERIDVSQPETAERANEILDKIIEVPAKLEAPDGENIITEAEAQEELKELFTELLDALDIDYTPELIESLAYLTIRWHLAEEIEKLKNQQEQDKVPQDTGTHEIIKKLLIGLSSIKKAMAHAGAIGKSALRLYTFNLTD